MMVPIIVSHATMVVAKNKKNCVRVLGREARSKSKEHFPPISLSGSSINVPATHLGRWSKTSQNNRTQGYVTHCLATGVFSSSKEKRWNW